MLQEIKFARLLAISINLNLNDYNKGKDYDGVDLTGLCLFIDAEPPGHLPGNKHREMDKVQFKQNRNTGYMSVICIIPARYNSSRFPGKLLARALGKTVIQRTWESALPCSRLDQIYVATDSEQIAEHAKQFGAEVLWTSSSPRDGTERITEALQTYPHLQKAELILNLQGDAPCTAPKVLEAIVETLQQDPQAVMSTAAVALTCSKDFHSPHAVKCLRDCLGNAIYFSRSPIPYSTSEKPSALLHVGIYCYRRSFLNTLATLPPTPLQIKENLEQLRILEWGYRIKIALVDQNPPSVDTPEDLLELENYLCQ